MHLPKSQKNKHTIGKFLRKQKNIRKRDPQARQAQMPAQLKQYIAELLQKGLQVKGLKFGEFKTKNGLPYPGLIAVQKIAANTIMVRVPVDCLLTTRVAFLSDIQKMFQENPKYFAKRFTSDWQDHILLAFILYEYQKGQKSEWYNLIRNLPKQIDYAIFWDAEEIENLQDNYMKIGILKEKQKFASQCQQFIKIASKYPQFYKESTITKDNIQWIHTHLVTRCFGKYFEYTTMVPFAQLFNHECTDVYYTMDYKPGNPNDQGEQFYEQKFLTQQQMNQQDTTNGTYDADDYYDFDEEVSLQRILKIRKQQSDKQTMNSQETQKKVISEDILKDIRSIKSYLTSFISFNDTVSLSFLCQTYQTLKRIPNFESVALQRAALQSVHTLNVRYLAAVKSFYNKLGKTTYSYGIRQKKKDPQPRQPDEPKQGQQYFKAEWPKDKFDDFVMLCSTKDQFQKGSQVYFCYGRLPNKLLLLRYGITLEHNKYDHIFLRVNIQQQFLSAYKAIDQQLSNIQMCKLRRFKVKRTKFCVQLVAYYRSKRWVYNQPVDLIFNVVDFKREKEALSDTCVILQAYLSQYKNPLQKNEKMLFDKSLNYHEHFALIYKIEQQRILYEQIKMCEYALQIIDRLQTQNLTLKAVLESQKDEYNLTRQIMMEKYFQTFK